MELALAAGLAIAGYEFMDHSGKPPAPKVAAKRDNIYDSHQVQRVEADMMKRAVNMHMASRKTATTGVVPNSANRLPDRQAWESAPDDALDGASFSTFGSLSDADSGAPDWLETEAKLTKPLVQKRTDAAPNYTEMFQPMSFDNPDGAVGSNDISTSTSVKTMVAAEADASLHGGWSAYTGKEMTYNVVSPGELQNFRETQLVPHFSAKSYGGGEDTRRRDGNIQNRLELFTGDNNIKPSKRESAPLFKPTRNAGNINGTPVMTDWEMSRYYVSERRDGEKPFEPVKVSPGLDMDYNEGANGGLMPSYNYRLMPKNVDQLRTANKPKKSYTTPVVPGQKGTSRGIQAPVNKYRPYRTTSQDHGDLQRTSFITTAPTTRGNYNFDPTNRQQTSIERIGAPNAPIADVGDNGGFNIRGKVQESSRTKLDAYNPGHAGQDGAGGIRRENHQLYENQRMDTEQTRHLGGGYQPVANVAFNPNDVMDVTMRQMTSVDNVGYSALSSYAKTALQSNDGAKPTLRQITMHQRPGYNITGDYRRTAALDFNDIRDPTGRQVIEDNKYLGVTTGPVSAVTTYWDPIAMNFKETTLAPQVGAGIGSAVGGGWAKTDIELDPTQRQMTDAYAPGLVGQMTNAGYMANPQQAFSTQRQDTEQTSHIVGTASANKRSGYDANPQQVPVTLKQLFESTKHIPGASQSGTQGGYGSNPQQAITTLRQFTEGTAHIGQAGQVGKQGGYGANPQQVTPTQRVGYEGTYNIGAADSVNKQGGSSSNPQQVMATQRVGYEGTCQIGGAGNAGQHGGYGSNPQQAITTLRQFTEGTKQIGTATKAVGGGGYESNPMHAGPTTRQGTIYERTGGNHGQDKYTPYVSYYGAEMGDKTMNGRPIAGNIQVGYSDQSNYRVRNTTNSARIQGGHHSNPQYSNGMGDWTRDGVTIPQESVRLDPCLIGQLDSNPYNIPRQYTGNEFGRQEGYATGGMDASVFTQS